MASRDTADREITTDAAEKVSQWSVHRLNLHLYRLRGWLASIIVLLIVGLLPTIYDQIFGFSAGFELHRVSLIGIFIIAFWPRIY